MLRSDWIPGSTPAEGPVLVSATDLTVFDRDDLAGVAEKGLDLAGSWPELGGAIGLWLWTEPDQCRSGAVSVWRQRRDLLAFVRWPVHVAIMEEYRDRGTVRSTTWTADPFAPDAAWAHARAWLMGADKGVPG